MGKPPAKYTMKLLSFFTHPPYTTVIKKNVSGCLMPIRLVWGNIIGTLEGGGVGAEI